MSLRIVAVLLFLAPLIGCGTFSQCDNVATLSAQTARWICEQLTSFDTTKTPTATDLARLNAIELFITQQADISRRYAFQLSQLGDTGQAQLLQERATALVQMASQIEALWSKYFR